MAKTFLNNEGSSYGHRHGILVRRAPVLYEASTGTDLNDARFPPREQYCDMQLAYRQQPRDAEALARTTSSELLLVFLMSLVGSIGAVLVGPFLPAEAGFIVAIIMGVFIAIAGVYLDRYDRSGIVLLFLAPTIVFLLLKTVALITAYRLAGAIVFGIAALSILETFGARPFLFYQDWLYTHPRLRPETRAGIQSIPIKPSQRVLIASLAIVVLVPMFSPSFALVAVVAVALVAQRRDLDVLTRFRDLVEILGTFVSYGGNAVEAPGIWFPTTSAARRSVILWLLGGSLFLSLAIGLDLMCPWDLVAADLNEYVSRQYRPEDLYGVPYGWITPAIQTDNFWLFAAAAALLATVPILMLTAIYEQPIRELSALRDRIESDAPDAMDNDGRCEWQWFVDRLCSSPHVAVNPMHREVREAEHLFLGVGPNAEYPVLLDKSILREHSYIVGETGSGKTALGIAPLLIQLIRGHAGPDGKTVPPPAIVILDLKGDNALFQTVKYEMERRREQYLRERYGDAYTSESASVEGSGGSDELDDAPSPDDKGSGATDVAKVDEEHQSPVESDGDAANVTSNRSERIAKSEEAVEDVVENDDKTDGDASASTEWGDDPEHCFRFFTPEKNMASHYFNPFHNLDSESRTTIQLCHLLLDALNLNHGEGYGRSYYSRRNRMLLFDALSHKPKSMEELYGILKKLTRGGDGSLGKPGDYGRAADTFELVSTIHAMTQYEMLATAENVEHPEQSIHMPELIEHGQVAYFWLPAALESISVREIGKLALFSLLAAAIDRSRRGEPPRQVYLVIDEFQSIAGENFKIILEQARSFGISAILANQTQSDLKTHDIDLRPTIRTNTRMKMYFGVTDSDEARELSESSGEELAFVRSRSVSSSSGLGSSSTTTLGWTHSTKPRLTRNDIIAATDDPLQFILRVSRGAGYTQFGGMPQLVRTTFPLTLEEYDRRMLIKWPRRKRHTVEAKESPAEVDKKAVAIAHEELEALYADYEE